MIELPIDNHLPAISTAVQVHSCVIIEAPPGTGKTTRVGPGLLPLADSRQIILVQPRRLAARTAARRIADEHAERLGDRFGYHVRFDRRRSAKTRLLTVTPGILLRKLQGDSVLESVQMVVLDEFHERSVEYDLILGMLRRIQTELRPDLRIVIMSATLDSQDLQDYLDQPPVIRVTADVHPVEVRHTPFRSQPGTGAGRRASLPRQIAEATAKLTQQATSKHGGDCLVFLPGVGEIRQVSELLEPEVRRQGWSLLQLFGDMSPEMQDQVLKPATERKLILATNVAETSLTIDGVRIVVDSGYARVQRFDADTGLDRLVLEPISMASAKQRTGRAGRTAPGICFRLWDQITERARASHLEPEIRRIDLVGPVLQLLCWGESDIAAFPWLSSPPEPAIEQAKQLLEWLGAVRDGRPTELGRLMLRLPVHPRLARLMITGHQMGIPHASAFAAAILSERDILRRTSNPKTKSTNANRQPPRPNPTGSWECDLSQRVLALRDFAAHGTIQSSLGPINQAAAQHALRVAKQFSDILTNELGPRDEESLDEALRWSLLSAYPDRVCTRRAAGESRGVMVGGRGVKLASDSGVTLGELFLAIQVDGKGSEALVRMASAIEQAWLPGNQLKEELHRFFNPTLSAVVTRERVSWHDLVLQETPVPTPADEDTAKLLAKHAAEQFDKLLPTKDKELRAWIARVTWLDHEMPNLGLPSFAPQKLPSILLDCCYGSKSIAELKNLPWKSLLHAMLDTNQRQQLETLAPASYQLPSGRQVLLKYEVGKPPVLEARIQEFFGLKETPKLAGGRVPLVLHLLAPNGRCQQITDDLASFWANTYPLVRKELRGRYPKHAWPEAPNTDS